MRQFIENFMEKLKGDRHSLPPIPATKSIMLAWLGGSLAMGIIAGLAEWTSIALLLGAFGASCVLVFGYPNLPFAQPRNVVFGHFISSLTGLIFLDAFGDHWWALGLSVGAVIALMMYTRTVHPPAGGNPVIVFITQPGWGFLLFPTLFGALLLIIVALIYNNATREEKYPKYW